LADTTVRCWGENTWGQLGTGTTASASSPVLTSGTGVTWASSNPLVATIDVNGLATAVNSGTSTITATDSSGASSTTTLTVPGRFVLTVARAGAGRRGGASSSAALASGATCSRLLAAQRLRPPLLSPQHG